MDPNNPLRGPRRALRRGEPPLRYGQQPSEAGAARRARQDDGGPFQNDRLVMQATRDEIWNNDDDSDDGPPEDDSDDDIPGGRMTYDSDEVDDSMLGRGQNRARFANIQDGDIVEADTDDDDDDEAFADEEQQLQNDDEDHQQGIEYEEMMEGDEEEDPDFIEEEEGGEDYLLLPGDLPDGHEGGQMGFDPMALGLKEINNLAHFSVSSHKPGNGVDELLSDDLDKFWQSDGPQPHLLTIHFLRRVEIRAIRFFVDYNQDESYTPTSISLSAGTGHHDLLEFSTLALVKPVGWQEIDLTGTGGGADDNSLCCWIVQVRVKENHQNGKDTHIRGIKLYGIDENALPPAPTPSALAGAAPPGIGLEEMARYKMQALHHRHAAQMRNSAGLPGVGAVMDPNDYNFEQLLMQSPERLAGSDRSGTKSNFFRDMEIR